MSNLSLFELYGLPMNQEFFVYKCEDCAITLLILSKQTAHRNAYDANAGHTYRDRVGESNIIAMTRPENSLGLPQQQ